VPACLVWLIHSQRSDVYKYFTVNFRSKRRVLSGRSDDDVSKLAKVVKSRKVGFIERLIHGVGQEERLHEIGFKILLHDVFERYSGSVLINIGEKVDVEEVNLQVLSSPSKINETWIAGEVDIL